MKKHKIWFFVFRLHAVRLFDTIGICMRYIRVIVERWRKGCVKYGDEIMRNVGFLVLSPPRWLLRGKVSMGNGWGNGIREWGKYWIFVMPNRYVFCFHKCSMNIFRFEMGWRYTCDEIPLSSDYDIIHLNSIPRSMGEMRWEADNDFDFVIIIFNIVNEFWSHSIFFQDDMFILIW